MIDSVNESLSKVKNALSESRSKSEDLERQLREGQEEVFAPLR